MAKHISLCFSKLFNFKVVTWVEQIYKYFSNQHYFILSWNNYKNVEYYLFIQLQNLIHTKQKLEIIKTGRNHDSKQNPKI